ncbi:hypothetical protein IEQ44_06320 [Nocardioides sp. Y6]|uniref:Uncharacterized protein n=1 Tax=Nocardioides malaquae TaxID=2773426 RepID=A0ABR9RRS5_9ACTN|nr:hypothetical protein [Nocardioides malaquae]MBE7324261.1 hypothetical protein [Nocardioides malaquae]
MSLCATMVERGAPGFLNVMVLVFFWNAVKFAWTALLAPVWIVHGAVGARREGECLVVRGQSEHAVAEASCS